MLHSGLLGLAQEAQCHQASVTKLSQQNSQALELSIFPRHWKEAAAGWHPAHIPASLPVPQFTAGEGSAAAALDVTTIPPITLPTAATQADPVFRSECDAIKPLPPAPAVPSLGSDNPESQGWHSPSRHPFSTDKETETERNCPGQGQHGCRWGPTVIKTTLSPAASRRLLGEPQGWKG